MYQDYREIIIIDVTLLLLKVGYTYFPVEPSHSLTDLSNEPLAM